MTNLMECIMNWLSKGIVVLIRKKLSYSFYFDDFKTFNKIKMELSVCKVNF